MPNFPALLRSAGLRSTPGRLAILETLERAQEPMTVTQLLRMLPAGMDRVTAYRSLEKLAAAGLARTVRIGTAQRYERQGQDDHHHVVCIRCDKTQDIALCAMEPLKDAITAAATEFAVLTDHSFEVFGTCKVCAKKGP